MNQLKAFCTRLSFALAVGLFAAAACAAQTPVAGAQSKTDKSAPAVAAAASTPDKDKPASSASTLEEELAKTPAGKTVAKFFAAFNSGDLKQMRAFHESTGGDLENADKDLEFYEQTGGLKLHSLSPRPTKDKIALLVQTKKDARWLTFEFTVGTDAPYPINSISARPAQPPAN
ncbi:MAG TPA: hypothetical protein VGO96_20820 [Pyrinomonadaceae bacterium]|jgi:hypothetical protein|nr:hypothetical protein [Pyrinomonadaceae bacterium]